MTPAAAPSPAVLSRIEHYLLVNRRELRRRVDAFLSWLRADGRRATPAEQQQRFTIIRLQFNTALSQFDLFAEVVTQRSERENGVWLSGLDVLAGDALHIRGPRRSAGRLLPGPRDRARPSDGPAPGCPAGV